MAGRWQVGGNDGDSAEMDEDEFEFAMIKLAALLRISLEDLCAAGLAEDAKKTGTCPPPSPPYHLYPPEGREIERACARVKESEKRERERGRE